MWCACCYNEVILCFIYLSRQHPLSGVCGDVDVIYELVCGGISERVLAAESTAAVFQDVRTNKPLSAHQSIVEWKLSIN